MRLFLIGSGGREHALAWKLVQSPRVELLFAAPGNPGIAELAEIAAVDTLNHAAIASFCRDNAIDLVVVGPEQPLVDGLADTLEEEGIAVFGPSAAAAQLEGSKQFTKMLCAEAGIPTARSWYFESEVDAATHVKQGRLPIVVKVDGLAAGKGVTIAETVREALLAITAAFDSGPRAGVLIEEHLAGVEASLFALSDGETVIPFGTAQDYKRALDGDRGPNTGGMGAISPAPALSPELTERAMADIVRPTVASMKARGTPYRGVLYAGLMLTDDGPKLIEYNVRFGDPECQVLMMRLDSDLVQLLEATAKGNLAKMRPRWLAEHAATITIANRGYPGAYPKGSVVANLEAANQLDGVTVFQAGTGLDGDKLVAIGGRVLNATAIGSTTDEARDMAYAAVAKIDWPQGYYRTDIGAPLI
jgi:phosphoribosylamine--glycine ligase